MDNRNNLDKALGLFIEAMRLFIPQEMKNKIGHSWDQRYYDSLSDKQRHAWDIQVNSGKGPEQMIDFHNLGGFAIREKNFLREYFGRETNNLMAKFNEIASARHMLAHYGDWDEDKVDLAFGHMIGISKSLSMTELEEELRNLKDNKSVEAQIAETQTTSTDVETSLTAWFNNVKPHLDIRMGNLDESVFAADLGEVALGTGREVYNNSTMFFEKTFFTEGLTNIAARVIKGLNGEEQGENRVISLQTGFGGGKTHTLISLYHLAKAGKNISSNPVVSEALTTLPAFDSSNIAVFTNTTNDPIQGRQVEDFRIRTLWGEIAYQLGGKTLYEKIRPNDEALSAPKGLFYDILKSASPSLILIDELADYCVAASTVVVGGSTLSDQTISFMQELTEAASKVKECVTVITLPASVQEVANSPQSEAILGSLKNRVARVGADTKPVAEEEIFEVIRYRLFEGFGDKSLSDGVIASYSELYQSLWSEIPSRAVKADYANLMKRAYPFHPELINIFKNKWASHPNFQRTRGVLRLLASIVSDLWQRRHNLTGTQTLIHPSHLQLDNLDTLTGEIKKLYGMGYDAVISSDVCGFSSNAYQIDDSKPEFKENRLTQGISTSIYLNSFGSKGVNQGITIKEIKLQLLIPNGFNHNSINSSLDDLQAKAFYLYYSQLGGADQRFWYHTKPNLNILINNALGEIKDERVESEIIELLESRISKVSKFKVIVAPTGDIPELKQLTLMILHPSVYLNGSKAFERHLSSIALKKGESDRLYRNTILFLSVSKQTRTSLYRVIREYGACHKIKEEYGATLESDQISDLKKRTDESFKKVNKEIVTAYSDIHKYVASSGVESTMVKQFGDGIDRQISTNIYDHLKEEEWILESIGHNTLSRNNLLPDERKPIRVTDVYQAFLRYDDKPMIISKDTVQQSISKYCYNKQYAIASKSGDEWTKMYYGQTIPMFDVDDETLWLVSRADYELWNKASELDQAPQAGGAESHQALPVSGSNSSHPLTDNSDILSHYKKVVISGKANAIGWNQLFNSFIMPLKENGVEVEFKIKASSNEKYPLMENSQQIKIVKESAAQLGYDCELEE